MDPTSAALFAEIEINRKFQEAEQKQNEEDRKQRSQLIKLLLKCLETQTAPQATAEIDPVPASSFEGGEKAAAACHNKDQLHVRLGEDEER
jgi:hypothetical protein